MKYLISIAIYSLFILTGLNAQQETYYSEILAHKLNGVTEYKVEGGSVDILTSDYAIEVKRASKWKHSIGQALWYALQTNRKPGIILIMKSRKDRIHGIRLQSALDHANLNSVKVWFYPEDFGGSIGVNNIVESNFIHKNNLAQAKNKECTYWINTGSQKNTRHNKRCTWFNNTTQGRFTSTKEGTSCTRCGG